MVKINYEQFAEELVNLVGGVENVKQCTARECVW